jgi:hypothetical protein
MSEKINGFLVHLSMNMWEDTADHVPEPAQELLKAMTPVTRPRMAEYFFQRRFQEHRQFDNALWHELLESLAGAGVNTIIFDVADGIRWSGHPELSLPESWSEQELKDELAVCRSYGIMPVPKLNFSSSHDAWLREYSRMLSTGVYYDLCRELIARLGELFDAPEYFHLGMDEECDAMQTTYLYSIVRRGELWWHDLDFFMNQVRSIGAKPWMWSDKLWHCGIEEFKRNVPLDVIQSNWYYSGNFSPEDSEYKNMLSGFEQLDEAGYIQAPAGSNWMDFDNYPRLVEFCRKVIKPERLLGFVNAPWYSVTREHSEHLSEAVKQIDRAFHC